MRGAGVGLVPVRAGAGVVWRCLPATPPPPTHGVADAERVLRRTLTTTADALVDLDVARWRPEVADELMDLRRPKEAMEAFELSLKRTPKRALSLLGLARAASAARDTATAQRAYGELSV